MLKNSADIKAYCITSFTGFEGIEQVVCENYTRVSDRQNMTIKYPLLWIMYPFTKRPIYQNGAKWEYKLEAVLLKTAAYDDYTKQDANFTTIEAIGEKLIQKLDADAKTLRSFEFDQNKDVGEWMPKDAYSPDNDNGYLIPITIRTFRCTGDCDDC